MYACSVKSIRSKFSPRDIRKETGKSANTLRLKLSNSNTKEAAVSCRPFPLLHSGTFLNVDWPQSGSAAFLIFHRYPSNKTTFDARQHVASTTMDCLFIHSIHGYVCVHIFIYRKHEKFPVSPWTDPVSDGCCCRSSVNEISHSHVRVVRFSFLEPLSLSVLPMSIMLIKIDF